MVLTVKSVYHCLENKQNKVSRLGNRLSFWEKTTDSQVVYFPSLFLTGDANYRCRFFIPKMKFQKEGGGCGSAGVRVRTGGCGACKYVFLPSLRLHDGGSSIHICEHRRVTFQLVASES